MEQIRDEQKKPKPEVSLEEELSKPFQSKVNNVIYCGIEMAEKLQKSNPEIFGKFKK